MAKDILSEHQGSEGGGEDRVEAAQMEEAKRLQAEKPCIDSALKNFLSLKLTAGLMEGDDATVDPATSQGCARVLLRTLNRLELPNAPTWGSKHPQKDSESGMEFMTRIGNYKVLHALWTQCIKAGQKPGRLLGRSALATVFPEVEAAIFNDLPGSMSVARATEEQLRDFVEEFRAILVSWDASNDASEDAVESSYAELVWAENFQAALSARQAARRAEASERAKRASTADDIAAEMKAALASGAGYTGSSSVTVEEVQD